MKRIGNLWSAMTDVDTMVEAVYEAIQFKHKDPMVVRTLITDGKVDPVKVQDFAKDIAYSLQHHTYQHDTPLYKHVYCSSKSKKSGCGKWRDIYCPSLKDHIVHHAIILVCKRAFMRGMDEHCCGSVPGRGIHKVKRYVEKWVRSNDTQFFVKLDIRKFFDSIKADAMMDCLSRHIKDKNVLSLLDVVLHAAPVAVPVGFYTSPWFANLYLQDLDHKIKQDLYKIRRGKRLSYVKHYVRYADDMLLMGNSKRDLEKSVRFVIQYCSEIGLQIKDCWEIKRIAVIKQDKIVKGTYRIDMCGYVFDRTRTIMRSGIYLSTMRLSRHIRKDCRVYHGYMDLKDCQALMSKTGLAVHADSYKMLNEINTIVNVKKVKGVISNAAKCGIF